MEAKQIYPCLWFNNNAKQAAEFYCSVFPDAKIVDENPFVVIFEANATRFMGLNGGPKYVHSPAVSFVVECDTQQQIDYYWERLGEDGHYDRCGWLTDRFGVSWQIVPAVLSQLMADPSRRDRVSAAFMKMQKFEIQAFLEA